MDDPRSGIVACAVAQAVVQPQLRQPTTAPNPAAEDRIRDGTDEQTEDEETLEAPPLCTRAGDDGRGGVHEHHFEEEPNRCCCVISFAREEEPGEATHTPRFAADHDIPHVIQRWQTTELTRPTDGSAGGTIGDTISATAHEREPANEETEHPDSVNHEIHRHRVSGVLAANQTRFH